jgi:hypothetical protein
MVVKPKYPFCFPFCLVTAVIDGTRCIHFRDQCLRCAAPRIARYGVVWRWAEPSQGPACRPPILTLLWMTASIKCQPTQPHRHDTLEMAESALQIPGVKGYWVEVGAGASETPSASPRSSGSSDRSSAAPTPAPRSLETVQSPQLHVVCEHHGASSTSSGESPSSSYPPTPVRTPHPQPEGCVESTACVRTWVPALAGQPTVQRIAVCVTWV